jgi:hypothetical protein
MSGRLGELLIKEGLVDEGQIATARFQCPDVRIGSALIIMRAVPAEVINRVLASQRSVPAIALAELEDCDPEARSLIPAALARRHHAIGIATSGVGRGRTLLVAMRDPGDLSAVDELAFATGMKIDARIAPEIYLRAALERRAASEPGRDQPGESPAPASAAHPIGSAPLPRLSVPLGPDPFAPTLVGRLLGRAFKLGILAAVVAAVFLFYRECIRGNTSPVGTHYASKALGVSIDFPDVGWRVAPEVGKKVTDARAEYFYRGNAPEFPIVGMLLVRSPNNQAAANAAEAVLGTIARNPRLRGCEGSDARPGAIMCIGAGALSLFGMVKGVVNLEVHAWSTDSDLLIAALIHPDKTTSETKQILNSIAAP